MSRERPKPGACFALALGLLLALGTTGCSEPGAEVRTLEHLSPIYTIDREYRSMKGPISTQQIRFPEAEAKELLWITGYRAVMVGEDGESRMSQEFMCHSNLDFDPVRHARLFDLPIYHTGRLFTLSQGQLDIEFPEGFGLPYYADETLSLTTQVLDLNFDGQVRKVRHKVTINYVRDRDLKQPMKPLFMTSGWGLVALEGEGGHFNVAEPSSEEHGESCLPGAPAGTDNYTDEQQRRFSGHWVVKPGREVNHTLVTEILNIPYDTTVHYIAVHLHPFAESLELVDLTTKTTIFKSKVENSRDRIGLDRVEYFSSPEGLPVYADHEYQIVSVYDNTTGEDQDSMAVMLLYLLDQKFEKPEGHPIEVPVRHIAERPVPLADERLLLHTSLGEITIGLYRTAAPHHAERLLELTRLGVYDTIRFFRVEPGFLVQTGYPDVRNGPPLTAEQQAAIRPLAAEFTDLAHERGIVSMVLNDNDDPNSAETSFFILLGRAPALDGRFTIVGRVLDGMETVERMTQVALDGNQPVAPILITRAEVVSGAL